MKLHKSVLLTFLLIVTCAFILIFRYVEKKEEVKEERRKWIEKEIEKAKKKGVVTEAAPTTEVRPVEGPQNLEVKFVQGKVSLQNVPYRIYSQRARAGMVVPTGTQINSSEQGQVDFSLPNGELKIRLKEKTDVIGGSIAYLKKRRTGEMELLRGTMIIKLEEDYDGSFKVITPSAVINAYGTAFWVEVYGDLGDTWVGVIEGKLDILNTITNEKADIGTGEELEITVRDKKMKFSQLTEEEISMMRQEISRMGSGLFEDLVPQMQLILPSNKNRLDTFLRTAAIATNGKEPMRIHRLLMEAITMLEKGLVEEDKKLLLRSIRNLETSLSYYKDPQYAPQLLMFIGVYYRNLQESQKAIEIFDKVVRLYPSSAYVSLAIASMGRIYEEDLRDLEKAEKMYLKILERYGDSYEVEKAKEGLNRLRERAYE